MTAAPPRLLLADHRGAGLAARQAALAGRGHELALGRSLRETVRLVGAFRPTVVVLDPLTRGAEELAALDLVRGSVPLLVLVARDDREAALRAAQTLTSGAYELAFQDATDEELEIGLRRLAAHARLLEEMESLRHSASHDDRTDLLRPKAFQHRLVEHFSAAQRHKLELAFVLMDLDKFGSINKRHDHTVGDRLIAKVGEVIRKNLRTEDVAGRLGGDEFAVLLPYTGKINAARVVGRLRSEIARLSGTIEGAKEPIPVSASIGFETYDGSDLEGFEALRLHAETALRLAKRRGGNQALYFRNLPGEVEAG